MNEKKYLKTPYIIHNILLMIIAKIVHKIYLIFNTFLLKIYNYIHRFLIAEKFKWVRQFTILT